MIFRCEPDKKDADFPTGAYICVHDQEKTQVRRPYTTQACVSLKRFRCELDKAQEHFCRARTSCTQARKRGLQRSIATHIKRFTVSSVSSCPSNTLDIDGSLPHSLRLLGTHGICNRFLPCRGNQCGHGRASKRFAIRDS